MAIINIWALFTFGCRDRAVWTRIAIGSINCVLLAIHRELTSLYASKHAHSLKFSARLRPLYVLPPSAKASIVYINWVSNAFFIGHLVFIYEYIPKLLLDGVQSLSLFAFQGADWFYSCLLPKTSAYKAITKSPAGLSGADILFNPLDSEASVSFTTCAILYVHFPAFCFVCCSFLFIDQLVLIYHTSVHNGLKQGVLCADLIYRATLHLGTLVVLLRVNRVIGTVKRLRF